MVLISWIPIGLIIFYKQLSELYKSIKQRRKSAKFVTPLLKKAVENSLHGEIDLKVLKQLNKIGDDDSKALMPNPREIKYIDRRG